MATVLGEVPMFDRETAARIAMEAASAAAARNRGEEPANGGDWRLQVARAIVATEMLAALVESWADGPVGIRDEGADGSVFDAASDAVEIVAAVKRLAIRLVGETGPGNGSRAFDSALAEATREALTGGSRATVVAGSLEALFDGL